MRVRRRNRQKLERAVPMLREPFHRFQSELPYSSEQVLLAIAIIFKFVKQGQVTEVAAEVVPKGTVPLPMGVVVGAVELCGDGLDASAEAVRLPLNYTLGDSIGEPT